MEAVSCLIGSAAGVDVEVGGVATAEGVCVDDISDTEAAGMAGSGPGSVLATAVSGAAAAGKASVMGVSAIFLSVFDAGRDCGVVFLILAMSAHGLNNEP